MEQQDSNWIDVNDRLPELEVPVLVSYGETGVYTAMRTHIDEGWYWAAQALYSPSLSDPSSYEADDEYNFTHWQHLPEPPTNTDTEGKGGE